MSTRTGKLVVEIAYELLDDEWDVEADLPGNVAPYLETVIDRAERDNHERFSKQIAYTLDSDVTVWTLEGYTADLYDLEAAKGSGT